MEIVARHGSREETVKLEIDGDGYHIQIGGREYEVDAIALGNGVYSLLIEGKQYEVAVAHLGEGRYEVLDSTSEEHVEVMDPLAFLALKGRDAEGRGGPRRVTAYMPGQVMEILAKEGEIVTTGQGILVLEAMKMKNEIQAESDGVLSKILVETGQTVEGGDPLFEIGPME
jgi:biotin carboxyl carrier protein